MKKVRISMIDEETREVLESNEFTLNRFLQMYFTETLVKLIIHLINKELLTVDDLFELLNLDEECQELVIIDD